MVTELSQPYFYGLIFSVFSTKYTVHLLFEFVLELDEVGTGAARTRMPQSERL